MVVRKPIGQQDVYERYLNLAKVWKDQHGPDEQAVDSGALAILVAAEAIETAIRQSAEKIADAAKTRHGIA